jgi:hypothetical protein
MWPSRANPQQVVDSQQLAKERFDQLSGVAQQHGKEAAVMARYGISASAVRMGTAALVAAVAAWMAWFFLPAFSIEFSSLALVYVLGHARPESGEPRRRHGRQSQPCSPFVGLVAIPAPFAVPFVRHPRVRLLNGAPLAYLAVAILTVFWKIVVRPIPRA